MSTASCVQKNNDPQGKIKLVKRSRINLHKVCGILLFVNALRGIVTCAFNGWSTKCCFSFGKRSITSFFYLSYFSVGLGYRMDGVLRSGASWD